MIAVSEADLFARQGTLPVVKQEATPAPSLRPSEIREILNSWNADPRPASHDPTSGQIPMEEALAIADDGLTLLTMRDILPDDFYKSVQTEAILRTNQITNPQNGSPSPEYGYWEITCSSDSEMNAGMSITVKINAVAGEIWDLRLETLIPEDANQKENQARINQRTEPVYMLEKFSGTLRIGNNSGNSDNSAHKGTIREEENKAVLSYPDGPLYAVASRQWKPSGNKKMCISIRLCLSANPF